MNLSDHPSQSKPGVAILSLGFRPFFFSAALLAAISLPLWLLALYGGFEYTPPMGWFRWHIHEMLFGVILAVIAGFTTTAVPKWTGTRPVSGWPLLLLWLTWMAGRVAALALEQHGLAAVDLIFMGALLAALGFPIVLRRNRRNYKILAILALLAGAQTLFLIVGEWSTGAYRLAVWLVVLLIAVIGARILPGFTTNGLGQHIGQPLMPPAPGRVDHLAAVGIAGVATLDTLNGYAPSSAVATINSVLALLSALLILRNSLHWRGAQTLRVPLLWSLHLGYLWLAIGLLLFSASQWFSLPRSLVIHAFTAGAMGTMVLAMMTRVSRGHSGRTLTAGRLEVAIYALVILGSAVRIIAGLTGEVALMGLAGGLWSGAFALFATGYAAILWRPARQGG